MNKNRTHNSGRGCGEAPAPLEQQGKDMKLHNGATIKKGYTTGHKNRETQNVGHRSFEGLLGICMHKPIGFEYV